MPKAIGVTRGGDDQTQGAHPATPKRRSMTYASWWLSSSRWSLGPAPRPSSPSSLRRPHPHQDAPERPPPTADQITETKLIEVGDYCACGGQLQHKTTHVRFGEDIPMMTKVVRQLLIERATCQRCRQVTTGQDRFGQPYRLNGQTPILGPDVRLYVCYLLAAKLHRPLGGHPGQPLHIH